MNGGDHIAQALERHGVRFVFTLCGGHISPILVAAKARGMRVVDCRHEVTAVFAADAVARLTGTVGVAAVTAGPGVTNTLTALENARLAQSPLVLLGGATATVLRNRGALQYIDQLMLIEPHVKWATTVERVRDLGPTLDQAFLVAAAGVPGPVFVEVPVDLLYDEALVRSWYFKTSDKGKKSLAERATDTYLGWHLRRQFAPGRPGAAAMPMPPPPPPPLPPEGGAVRGAVRLLARAERPVLLVGSQAMLHSRPPAALVAAIEKLGVPVYLSGMARGLLGARHPQLLRHQRKEALRGADLVLLAGVPADFRLDYGRQIRRQTPVVAANRSAEDLRRNRKPTVDTLSDAALFLEALAEAMPAAESRWRPWLDTLRGRDAEREADIDRRAVLPGDGGVNPLALCRTLDRALADDAILVGDGGDFVATASYSLSPRGPLQWLDPGVFGTLGVGAGFALGAKLVRPDADVWLLYGDGAAGYSLAEYDTFVRHGVPVIAVVGNDAGWTQIAREQVEILGDDVGTVLLPTAYEKVVEGWGGAGLRLGAGDDIAAVLAEARELARGGRPVLVNALLGKTDFRKGSISM